jgi:hypothetical protein
VFLMVDLVDVMCQRQHLGPVMVIGMEQPTSAPAIVLARCDAPGRKPQDKQGEKVKGRRRARDLAFSPTRLRLVDATLGDSIDYPSAAHRICLGNKV